MAAVHRRALPAPRAFGHQVSGKTLLIVLAIVTVAAAALQVNQFSRAASTGYTIDALTQQRAAKQAENHELEAEVAQLSSLGRVESEARGRLGLVPAAHKMYVTVNQQVPDRQSLPLRFESQLAGAPTSAPPAAAAPAWKRLLRLLPFF